MAVQNHKKEKIVAMVPAKIGSRRLAMKNLALINGEPLVYYAIKAAKESDIFDRIVVNAEDALFSEIARRYHVDFYKRPKRLVGPTTKTDVVVYDFLKKNICDIVAWVSPIAPFQTGEQVKNIVEFFIKKRLDSLITVKNEQVHCIYKDKPINFEAKGLFARTQELTPVQPFVYSTMMWRRDVFVRMFEKKGHAILCGKTGFYPVSKLSAAIIKKKEDLMLADYLMRQATRNKKYRVNYDKIIGKLRKGNE